MKLEHLQRPRDDGGLALPNPWLYYLAAHLQHLISTLHEGGVPGGAGGSSSEDVMLHTVQRVYIPEALETQAFVRPHQIYPTNNLIQKVWNKVPTGSDRIH